MKKLLFASLLVSAGVYLLSLADHPVPDDIEFGPPPYSGPPDDFDIRDGFWVYRKETTFGKNAKYSDIIAIGTVVTQDLAKLLVKVDIPLVGCTNGQPVTIVHGSTDDPELLLQWYAEVGRTPPDSSQWTPTNQARIVFCVSSNNVSRDAWFDWSGDYEIDDFTWVTSYYWLREDKRSWWYADRDNGLVLEQFTNVVQAVRLDRNWTNYFHLTRDGMYKDSIRIKEDSFYDMEGIVRSATTNQAYLIYNDPLVLPEHKALFPLWHPYVIK